MLMSGSVRNVGDQEKYDVCYRQNDQTPTPDQLIEPTDRRLVSHWAPPMFAL